MSIQRPATVVLPSFMRPVMLDDQQRVGGAHDGGYVLPLRLLTSCRTLLSFGINLDWRFELDVVQRFPATHVESFDATTTFGRALWWGISRFLNSPISRRPEHFTALTKPVDYFTFTRHARIKHHAQFIGLRASRNTAAIADVITSPSVCEPVLIKMDIEGAEYEVLDALVAHHDRIAGIVVEFHDADNRRHEFIPLVERLQRDYYITHVHANNFKPPAATGMPKIIEMTFMRHALVPRPHHWEADTYRLPIDAPNLPALPDLDIRFDDSGVPD